MGLDMYLYADKYLGRWAFMRGNEQGMAEYNNAEQILELSGLKELQVDPEESGAVHVRATVGYWRKANQIHKWFVENVQGGVDDCRAYYVETEQLEELKEKCILVLASSEMVSDMVTRGKQLSAETDFKWQNVLEVGQVILDPKVAQEELPSTEGFFFGSTDYDDYYVADLVRTVEIIEKVLPAAEAGAFDIYYDSSW